MAASSMQRPSAPLKTYSRRVNNNPDPPPTKKRLIQELSIVQESSLPKKFKPDSIQNYFKPLPTPDPSSDPLEPSPPSSPPSQTSRSPPTQLRSLQRPRRRLNARPNLAPINKMSYNGDNLVFGFDDDERDTTPYLTTSSASSSTASLASQRTLVNPVPGVMTPEGLAEYHRDLGIGTVQPHTDSAGPSTSRSTTTAEAADGSTTSGNSRQVNSHDESSTTSNPTCSAIDIPKKVKSGQVQTFIDLGQTFSIKCKDCGMPYVVNNKADLEAHAKFHREVMGGRASKKTIAGEGIWQEYRDIQDGINRNTYVNTHLGGAATHHIRVYDRTASSAARNKAEDVYASSFTYFSGVKLTSKELWSEIADPHNPTDRNLVPRNKLYIYSISEEPVALLLAERVLSGVPFRDGHPVVPSPSFPVRMSIERIWVKRERQRGGIATKLVDVALGHFINGMALSKSDIAFSLPTSAGAEFARRYVDGVAGVGGGWFLVVL